MDYDFLCFVEPPEISNFMEPPIEAKDPVFWGWKFDVVGASSAEEERVFANIEVFLHESDEGGDRLFWYANVKDSTHVREKRGALGVGRWGPFGLVQSGFENCLSPVCFSSRAMGKATTFLDQVRRRDATCSLAASVKSAQRTVFLAVIQS